MKHVLYDANKERAAFDKEIAKFEKKLTKANKKGKSKQKDALEEKAKKLIDKRFEKLAQFEFDGFGACEKSINYDEHGNAKIFATFEKTEIECVTADEFLKLIGENAVANKQMQEKQQMPEHKKDDAIASFSK